MSEGDGGIQLNLSSGVSEKQPRKRQPSPDPEEQSGKKPKRVEASDEPEGRKGLSGGDAGGLRSDGTVVSSLFKHNPEIPQLNFDSEVRPVTEAVFTDRSFSEVGIHPHLVKNMADMGLASMTNVQSKAIPLVLASKDLLVKSQTGSGKTLAYAVPILHKLQEIRPKISRTDGTFVLVIVPTRELAIQSFEWFQKLCRSFAWIVPGVLLGGEKKKSEKARVRKGINMLISTPGRLIDHITHTKCLSLNKIKYLVLDEADRMLELGYERDVQTILSALNAVETSEPRQTMLLSATLTTGIEQLSEVSMKHPTFVDAATDGTAVGSSVAAGGVPSASSNGGESGSVPSDNLELTTPENLKQNFVIVPAKLRLVVLAAFILWKARLSKTRKKILVFMATQDMVDFHCDLFDRCLNGPEEGEANSDDDEAIEGAEDEDEVTEEAKAFMQANKISLDKKKQKPTASRTPRAMIKLLKLHGSMKQKDRLDVFNAFRAGGTEQDNGSSGGGVLFCTDVAARGLDLPAVDWIVQYNPPVTQADYVHRVGRTARIGSKGSGLLFVLPSEANFVLELEKQKLVMAELTAEHVLEKMFNLGPLPSQKSGLMPRSVEESATNLQMKMENSVANCEELHASASQSYVSLVRSYASYPKDVRHIFSFKALHLGHIAKSFALRDPPNKITGIGKGNWVRKEEVRKKDEFKSNMKREQTIISAQKKRINQKSLVMSEYDSGFKGIEAQNAKMKEKERKKQFKKLKR